MGDRFGAAVRRRATPLLVAAGVVFANAHAAPILLVDGTGRLTGATGVDVGGTLFNVEFLDGTCNALFSGCNELADFTFTTGPSASAASDALLAQVFGNAPLFSNFDVNPELTRGCDSTVNCFINTPFSIPAPDVGVSVARNDELESLDLSFLSSGPPDFDTSVNPFGVWAIWTPSLSPPPPSVPEPGTIAILTAGLLTLVMTRRRRKS